MKPINPREELDNVLKYWWLIALLAILGGAIGLLIHNLRAPLYDATAVLTISINFPEEYQLTQFEEDHAVNTAAAVIISTAVMEQVVEEAQAQGISIDVPTLWSKLHLERRQERWTLIIRDSDPQRAATLANLFAERGLDALAEAHSHALQARSLQRTVEGQETCLVGPAEGQEPPDFCGQISPQEIRDELQRVNDELNLELIASQGVLPTTVFSLTQTAFPPDTPVQFGQNIFVFAGGIIGFILGVILVNLRLPQRLARRR